MRRHHAACRQVVLQWTTRDRGTPTAQVGSSPGNYTISETGTYTTYLPSDLCTSPANDTGYIFPGFFNAVTLENLMPSTKYYYTVGDPVGHYSFSVEGKTLLMDQGLSEQMTRALRALQSGISCLGYGYKCRAQPLRCLRGDAEELSGLLACKGAIRSSSCPVLQGGQYSAEYYFTTPPAVGPDSNVSMIVWADSGQAIADGSYEWEW